MYQLFTVLRFTPTISAQAVATVVGTSVQTLVMSSHFFLKRCTLRLVRPRGAGRLCRVQGIIDTALARALHELEEDGILTRHDAKTMPMSVTYHLTDLGKKLMPALNALYGWGEEHRASAEEYKRSDGNKNL